MKPDPTTGYRLTWKDAPGVIYAWWLLLLADIKLRTSTDASCLRPDPVSSHCPDDPHDCIERTAAWVRCAAQRHIVCTTCLRKSLVMRRLLARQGILAQLVIGAHRRLDGSIGFHAWLTCDGQAIDEAPEAIETNAVLMSVLERSASPRGDASG